MLGSLLLAGWLVGRERLIPRRPAPSEETLAGHTVALLALGLIALVVVATNPFALVYLLPSLYAWLWLPQAHAARPVARGALLALGLAGPLILLALASRPGSTSASTRRGTCSRSSPSATSPGSRVVLGLVWLAVAAQLAALAPAATRPYPERSRRRAARTVRRRCSRDDDDAARGAEALEGPG